MSSSEITKRALAESLLAELSEKPLERITVADVTGRCGLSRQTFYYHFNDIYGLIAWIYEREARDAIGGDRTYGSWQQGLLAVLERLLARKDFIMRTTHAVDSALVMSFLRDRVGQLLGGVVEEESAGRAVSEDDRQLVATFYAAGIIDVVWSWVAEGMVRPPREVVDRLSLVIQGDIPAALDRLAGNRGIYSDQAALAPCSSAMRR